MTSRRNFSDVVVPGVARLATKSNTGRATAPLATAAPVRTSTTAASVSGPAQVLHNGVAQMLRLLPLQQPVPVHY